MRKNKQGSTTNASDQTSTDAKTRAAAKKTAAAQDKRKEVPPGLDAKKHAAEQRAVAQAEAIRDGVFPAIMETALGYEKLFESRAYRVFLEQLTKDCGSPKDPIEQMLIQQLALAHFRIGKLHMSAGTATVIEVVKIYNAAAARLLGEFRRTALALRVYRSKVPEGSSDQKLKIFKLAQ